MRRSAFQILPVIIASFTALLVGGCQPADIVSQKENKPAVHGELIVPAPKTVAVPTKPTSEPIVVAKTEIVSPAIVSAPLAAEVAKPVAPTPAPPPAADGYSVIGFDKLASYNFQVDDAPVTNQPAAADKANEQIPSRVKALNDQKVSIKGFMLPLKVADGTVTEFLIMKDQSMCCYGSVPKITEWVSVKTPGKGVKPIMDQPISIMGTLHVGAMRENGYLVGIYQMEGDKLDTSSN